MVRPTVNMNEAMDKETIVENEAKSIYSDIQVLTQQVQEGVKEAIPALEEAKRQYSELINNAAKDPDINIEAVINNIQQPEEEEQPIQANPNGLGAKPSIFEPNPKLMEAKNKGLGTL